MKRIILCFFLFFVGYLSASWAYVVNIASDVDLYPKFYENCKGNTDYGDIKSASLIAGNFWVSYRQGMNASGNCMEAFGLQCQIGTVSVTRDRYGHVCHVSGSCPENSSKDSQGFCQCNSGYQENENGTACIKDPCEMLESFCAGSQNFKVSFYLDGNKAGVNFVCMNPLVIGDDGSFPGCTRGCLAIVGGFTMAFQSDGGDWVTQGQAKYTGSTCDPSVINDLNSDSDPEYEPEDNPTLTEKPDETCPNGFKGTVNGVSVCLPPKASEGLLEKEEKDNGDGTKTEKQTKVKCENGVCEITTTTITKDTSSNTVVSNSSATTTLEQGRFCAQNPTAAACKNENGEEGKGSFSGSCQAGFACDGDAVMCAIAKEQHTRACQLFKEDTPEGQLYAAEKGKEGVQRGEGSDVGAIDLGGGSGSLIKTDSLIGEGSCVQDLQFQFMGEPVTIPLSSLCPYLVMLGNILVAVGMVMAIRIVGVR